MVLIHTHTIQFTSLRYTCGVLRILSLYHRSSLTLIYMYIFSIKLYMFAQNFIALDINIWNISIVSQIFAVVSRQQQQQWSFFFGFPKNVFARSTRVEYHQRRFPFLFGLIDVNVMECECPHFYFCRVAETGSLSTTFKSGGTSLSSPDD